MTSPEWEAANEDDSDRFPQPSPHVAPPPRVDLLQSDPARVARYAEVICRAESVWLNLSDAPGEVQAEYQRMGRAVIGLADEERDKTLAAMVRTCTACGAGLHIVGMDAWRDPTRKVEP